uniref:PD-(D/E)XK nuclease superfamily protein n=1 Tax=Candidatus Kentrum sp. MB TaxID=2138164 RepID=A0A451BFG9_9GAMM|nr:MAG: PD-(D/E)XK nuclease superfamily protein [Candidatus Kentron sp. MB]VFK77034.1 MAG: PD-(D/E)XK nuclease superfamily protein [Candidatus Kentron sp. MB]
MSKPRRLPIGIQDFARLRTSGCVYVDKTELICQLITEGVAWFLSRPRRFGKSLLVSTLAAIFQGRRELFEGLWIEGSDYDWTVYPVLHVDMSRVTFETPEQFQSDLVRQLGRLARNHELELGPFDRAAPMLDELIEQLANKKGEVVVLIDEYDKPILNHLTDVPKAIEIRDRLRDIYVILKAQNKNLRFVLLTGVSRFSKVSVFSDLNHLNDITYVREYDSLVGYTQGELESHFSDHLQAIAERQGIPTVQLLDQIRSWYNGYRFHPEAEAIYNPFSCLLYLSHKEFKPWWFDTGTPTFLIDLIRKSAFPVEELERNPIPESAFSNFEIDRLEPLPLLQQTGYLTIADYDKTRDLYILDYPNREVRGAFLAQLLRLFSDGKSDNITGDLWRLQDALATSDLTTFFEILTGLFAHIPYDIQVKQERYYQSLFYLIFRIMGLHIHTEVRTATGRIDATVEMESGVWIFEFKLDGSADEAIAQIRDKDYAAPYAASGKPVYLVGANFDSDKRNVGEWKMMPLTT